MKRVDLGTFRGVADDRYDVFAWKSGIPFSSDIDDRAAGILVKFDTEIADFTNERFVVEFMRAVETWDSVMFAAVLSTRDANVTPVLSRWTLRLTQ